MRVTAIITAILLLGVTAAAPDVVIIEADRDATLIEDPDGSLANGAGPALFAGRTAQSAHSVRRAILHFDVAAALPARAVIEAASLSLHLNPSNAVPSRLRLHRVLEEWGEGDSSSSGGGGAPSGPGDVTWIHTFWDTEEWIRSGGHFVGRASAELEADEPGLYTWESTKYLTSDVRIWKAAPAQNFGWILIGDETTSQTAKAFASREHPDSTLRPVLEITYRIAGDAHP